MTKRQTVQYEMLVRVREFGKLHQERFVEGSEGRQAFAAVAQAIAELDQFSGRKQTMRRVARQTKEAARRALSARVVAIAGSARVLAKSVPDADARFPLPAKPSDVALLQAGLLFLKEAVPVKDGFVRCGLPATFLEELQQAVSAFEQAIEGRHEGKSASKASQVALRDVLAKALDTVKSLDVLVANTLGHEAPLMAAWKSKRQIERVRTTARVAATQPAPSPEASAPPVANPTPVAGPNVTPEAPVANTEPATGEGTLRRAS